MQAVIYVRPLLRIGTVRAHCELTYERSRKQDETLRKNGKNQQKRENKYENEKKRQKKR